MEKNKTSASILLLAFNQQDYIKDAVSSAFSQDYDNLEIILSDDCSSDSTFNIIEDLYKNYEGKHKVIINRNSQNLGIGEHVNRAFSLSSGEIIFFFAGDDISLNSRVSKCIDIFDKNPNIYSVFTHGIAIDETGNENKILKYYVESNNFSLEERIKRFSNTLPGFSHSIRKTVFQKFGPLNDTTVNEDEALVFRSLMLGNIYCIHEILVKRRVHKNNVFTINNDPYYRDNFEMLKKRNNYSIELVKQFKADLYKFRKLQLIDEIELQKAMSQLYIAKKKFENYKLYYSDSYLNKIKGAVKLCLIENGFKIKMRLLLGGFIPFFNVFYWGLNKKIFNKIDKN